MMLEFVKAHTGKDGRSYTVGQLVEIADTAEAQELIRQGVAKERKAAEGGETPEGGSGTKKQ
jgi:hypothetical protein